LTAFSRSRNEEMIRMVTIPGSWYGREAVFSDDDDIVTTGVLQAVYPERYTDR
jgi:hypothetical protein